MVKIYGIKNCDSVKKALKFFKTHHIDFELIDFRQTPVGCDKIDAWLQKTDIEKLFNARSTTYRTLNLKTLQLDESGKREWLCKENLLIKRPVIEKENRVIIGFNQPLYEGEFIS